MLQAHFTDACRMPLKIRVYHYVRLFPFPFRGGFESGQGFLPHGFSLDKLLTHAVDFRVLVLLLEQAVYNELDP